MIIPPRRGAVTKSDALKTAERLGGRLPTVEELKNAARSSPHREIIIQMHSIWADGGEGSIVHFGRTPKCDGARLVVVLGAMEGLSRT